MTVARQSPRAARDAAGIGGPAPKRLSVSPGRAEGPAGAGAVSAVTKQGGTTGTRTRKTRHAPAFRVRPGKPGRRRRGLVRSPQGGAQRAWGQGHCAHRGKRAAETAKKAGWRRDAAAVGRRARSSGSNPTTTPLLHHHEEPRARYVAAHETCRQSAARTVERTKLLARGTPREGKTLTSGTRYPRSRAAGAECPKPDRPGTIRCGAMRRAPGPSNRGRPVPVRREAHRGGSVNPGSGRTAVQPRLAPSPRWAAAPSTGAVRCSS